MAALRMQGLSKRFGAVDVLVDVSLDVADGEFIVFVGPSGCGKSTTLRMIAGLEECSSGRLYLGERDVTDTPAARRGVAMVFQSYALYPHMTVRENLSFALKLAGRSAGEIRQAVEGAAAVLQLDTLLERRPRELSGGQRQRVAIGRAIVRQPEVFLFDEPLSNLDAALRVQMRVELARLHQLLGTTMVYVTHDQVEAMTLGERIAVFNRGRIEQCAPPLEVYERPATRFVAGFIGSPSMNFVPVQLQAGVLRMACGSDAGPAPASLAPGVAAGGLVLGIRPEHVELQPTGPGADGAGAGGAIHATVRRVEHLGDHRLLHLDLPGGQTLVVSRPAAMPVPLAGSAAGVRFPAEQIHLFSTDADGRRLH